MSESFHVKYELFWLSGSQGKTVSMTFPSALHFHDYLPLGRGPDPLFEQFKIPFTQGSLYHV
jgi:hypothetical protein